MSRRAGKSHVANRFDRKKIFMKTKIKSRELRIKRRKNIDCKIPRTPAILSAQCEEYGSFHTHPTGSRSLAVRRKAVGRCERAGAVETRLCRNGEHRKTCAFSHLKRGVPYCEEYQ